MGSSALTPDAALEQKAQQQALLLTLRAEFDRLNAQHFGSRFALPEIVLSTRKTFGGYYQPSRHRIVLSWQAYHEYGLPETLNTFRHEVAHIAHPNHSKAFWAVAYALGATQRHAKPPLQPSKSAGRRYVYACPACGRQITRLRRLRASSCASCDRRYNPRFALQLVASINCHSGEVSPSSLAG